mmetsp:Transcript_18973/g.59049  ORF Transcript_18973/g.59049 Transcript_18973/m.59049 type:complete len:208 (-) Transcript_18973:171-794(-)
MAPRLGLAARAVSKAALASSTRPRRSKHMPIPEAAPKCAGFSASTVLQSAAARRNSPIRYSAVARLLMASAKVGTSRMTSLKTSTAWSSSTPPGAARWAQPRSMATPSAAASGCISGGCIHCAHSAASTASTSAVGSPSARESHAASSDAISAASPMLPRACAASQRAARLASSSFMASRRATQNCSRAGRPSSSDVRSSRSAAARA